VLDNACYLYLIARLPDYIYIPGGKYILSIIAAIK